MKAIALDLAASLHAYADELTEECVSVEATEDTILDTVFDVVKRLKEETLSQYHERTIRSYDELKAEESA
jgi:hypothetical protein